MKRLALVLAVAGALLVAQDAHAQFANRSLSLQVGYMDLDQVAGLIEWGVPLGLYYSGYIENGFEYTFGVSAMLLTIELAGQVEGQVIGLAGGAGFRYLFLEEEIRPYLGLELTYLRILFGDVTLAGEPPTANWAGLGPNAGVDYFLADTVSVGLKAQFNVYAALTTRLQFHTSKGIFLTASAWF